MVAKVVEAATSPTETACDFKTPHVGINKVANVTTVNKTTYLNKFAYLCLILEIFRF